jgi:hypothetical protein
MHSASASLRHLWHTIGCTIRARPQVFKAVPGTAAGRAIGCRWLDDGADEELAYFELGGSGEGSPGRLKPFRRRSVYFISFVTLLIKSTRSGT